MDEMRRFTVYLYRMPTERELLEGNLLPAE